MESIYVTLLGLLIIAIFTLCRGIYKLDKREHKEIQEHTDLEIEGMKRQIVANCNERLIYTESCKKCKIGNTCKRCYKAPRIENCDDWETDDVLAAYELLKENR